MATRIGIFAGKLLLLAVAIAPVVATGSSPRNSAATSITPGASVAELPTEVRVRRLHLVRPDLIRYPIAYEVLC